MRCPWLTKNTTTKAKGYILLKKGKRKKQKALKYDISVQNKTNQVCSVEPFITGLYFISNPL